MVTYSSRLVSAFAFLVTLLPLHSASLFDGKTFTGWVGETNQTWRIVDGTIVGGSLTKEIPQNEFLRSTRSYTNFVLQAKFKLEGTNGFVNAGVQIRSKHVEKPAHELSGYQADIGAGWWGALYDEWRRNKVLVKPEKGAAEKVVKLNDWNEYKIRAEGKRIQTWINGAPMIDYMETDDSIPQHGIIGLQIHSGGPAQVYYKDIAIEELP